MAQSRRCTICSISFPPEVIDCPVCGGKTWAMYKNPPDENWKEKAERLLGALLDEEAPAEGIAYSVVHPVDAKMPVHVGNDRIWLTHTGLLNVGYKSLEDGSIVFVNDSFYELQGYDKRSGMWWVEEIITEGIFDELTPEDVIKGGLDG